jgi:hypothetical protein
LGRVSIRRNLNRSLKILSTTTKVVGTPQMVFTNSIMFTHVKKTTNQQPVNLVAVGGYKSTNAKNPQ